jgi:transposase
MHVKTILNRVEKFKSFVYGKAELLEENGRPLLLVEVLPRRNGKPLCSRCERASPGYDTLAARRFEFVPVWGIAVFFLYSMRRVNCALCGIVVEKVPWAEGKHRLCTSYMWFLARWAKRLCWTDVAEAFQTSWEQVFRAVGYAVQWGLVHRSLKDVSAIGVDEVLWHRGHKYLTVVYQIDQGCKRLLWLARDRTEETLRGFFVWFGEARTRALRFVCSDMWKPYLEVVAEKAPEALHVLDRFHIVATMNRAIDEVRAKEARGLVAKGYQPVLKHSRWCLLKRPENLTDKQDVKLADLLRYNLKTVRAYLLKEDFQFFWNYVSPHWAGWFLDRWCKKVMRSRIAPMKKIALSLRNHRELIMNWFRARNLVSLGAVEGLNNKLKVVTRKSYGFRTFEATEIALYHTLGALPQPEFAHRFC